VTARLSPRSRRWRRFLRGLSLDPDALPRPVTPPGPRDFIICGPSRSGTTLLCAALHQPPAVVTVMEPWDGMRLPPAELFASLRREIGQTGHLSRGRLDVETLDRQGGIRWQREGAAAVPLPVEEDGYLLGVKWPAYWRYLELLPRTRFLVCVRHPFEVVASFRASGGRLAQGLDYDTAFNRGMNRELRGATADPTLRRVLLYDYVVSRLLPHLDRPGVLVVRYERWFQEPEVVMGEVEDLLGVPLRRGTVKIRPPDAPALGAEERRIVTEHCRTAGALGYRLSEGSA
jgi:hypothetical protein